jgi:hypothetical protein
MIDLKQLELAGLPEAIRALMEQAQRRADVCVAGKQLSKLRRKAKDRPRRIYTGVLGRKRGWRGMRVVLPDGRVGVLFMAWRGLAWVNWRDEFALKPDRYGVFKTTEIFPFKLPAARLLGSAKRGCKERVSQRKAEVARLNGRLPVRLGSRPRGRPPKRTASPGTLEG